MFTGLTINNESEHRAAIEEVESLFGSEPGTAEFVRIHRLVDIIEAYEAAQEPDLPTPSQEAREQFRREQMGVGVGELVAA